MKLPLITLLPLLAVNGESLRGLEGTRKVQVVSHGLQKPSHDSDDEILAPALIEEDSFDSISSLR